MLITFYSKYGRLFAPDGSGSGSGDDDPDERVRSEDVISRAKDDKDAIARLGRELDRNEDRRFKLRDARRGLQTELTDLRGKLPGEGTVILSGDQAKIWDAYQKLGTPEDLGKAVKDRDLAQGELGTFRRNASMHAAAEAHGYKATALAKMPSLAGKTVETREIDVEGQKAKRSFVKDGDKETPLDDYLREYDADLMGALTAEGGSTQQRQNSMVGGKPYPTQQSNSNQQRQQPNAGASHVARTKYAVPGSKE